MKKSIIALIFAPLLILSSAGVINQNNLFANTLNIRQAGEKKTVSSISVEYSISLTFDEKDVDSGIKVNYTDGTFSTTAFTAKSDDESIVTIKDGKLTSYKKAGTATITITSTEDTSITATMSVTVKDISKWDFSHASLSLTNGMSEDSNLQKVYDNGGSKHVAASTKTLFIGYKFTGVKDDKGQNVSVWSGDKRFLYANVTLPDGIKSSFRAYDESIDGDEGFDNQLPFQVLQLKGDKQIVVTATSVFHPEIKSTFTFVIDGYEGTQVVDDFLTSILDNSELTTDQDQKLSYTIDKNFGKFYFSNSNVQRLNIGANVTEFDPVSLSTARKLEEINVDAANANFVSIDGVLYRKGTDGKAQELLFYPIGKTDESFTTPEGVYRIGDYAISRQRHLQELILSEGISEFGNYTFFNSTSIQKWSFPSTLNADKLVGLGNTAFTNGAGIKELKIYNTKAIDDILDTDLNGQPAFFVNITKVEFMDTVTTISNEELFGFKNVQEMIIPATVTSIGKLAKPEIGEENYNDVLKDAIILPKSLKKLTIAEDNPVYKTDGFGIWTKKDGTLRGMVTGNDAPFLGEYNYYETPDEVTTISSWSLILGDNLKRLKINKNVTKIEENAIITGDGISKIFGTYYVGYGAQPNSALEYIEVDDDNANYEDLNGILFSKDGKNLIKFPNKYQLSNLFGTGSSQYEATKEEVDRGGAADGEKVTRYYNKMYAIPEQVTTISSLAFDNVSEGYRPMADDSTIQFLYFPKFALSENDKKTPNYINDHIIKIENNAFGFDDFPSPLEIFFPSGYSDYYLHQYNANNAQVKKDNAPAYNDDLLKKMHIYTEKQTSGDKTEWVYSDKIQYFNEYSNATEVNKGGDPFMVEKGFAYMKDPSLIQK